MSNATPQQAHNNFTAARAAYDAAPSQATYDAMRAAHAARTRADQADAAAWDAHENLNGRRLAR
jgi:hypothetical protein